MNSLTASVRKNYNSSKVFVVYFKGDMQASAVESFREEISAILLSANPKRGDKVIVKLDSPGGTVTGYGLATAQLERLKVSLRPRMMYGLTMTLFYSVVHRNVECLHTYESL